MSWPQHIEQWRQYAIWEGRDIPPDLMLAIIAAESGGQAGRLSQATTKPAAVPRADGSEITFNRAMGLTQCIPSVVAGYAKAFKHPAYFEDMTGSDERAARLQVRLGAWVFASGVRLLHDYDPIAFPAKSPGASTPEQLKLALVAYAIGFGNLKKKLDVLKEEKTPLALDTLKTRFPWWGYNKEAGQWINRPIQSSEKKWALYTKNMSNAPGADSPANPLALPPFKILKSTAKTIKDNWIWLLISILGAFFWQKYGPKKSKSISAGPAVIIGRK